MHFFFDDLYAVTLCGTFFPVTHFIALFCWCLREASRKEGVPKDASFRAACNMNFGKLVFQNIESSWVFLLQSIGGIGNKKLWFSEKKLHFGGNKSFSRAVGFVEKKRKMDELIAFHRIFGSCVLRRPRKDFLCAVPWRGSFGRILTMQLEPPKLVACL